MVRSDQVLGVEEIEEPDRLVKARASFVVVSAVPC